MTGDWARPLVLTHVHKCAGSSLRRMLYAKAAARLAPEQMHVPEITCREIDNLPMMEGRGEPLPSGILLLADHSPFGIYEARVLVPDAPFRVTLLRHPIDRLESYYFFCARAGFLGERWAAYADRVADMPDRDLRALGRHFLEASAYAWWFDPLGRRSEDALANLRRYDVVADAGDLWGFCQAFTARNPYGIRFEPEDVLTVNETQRTSGFTLDQRGLLERVLAEDLAFWDAARRRYGW